ncbi:hypothetical protein EV182_004799 [Spiromyces aspiralis]|uniref:Uncharacterized protein n=1 Tax=Spiromyces aspiralis TaxID=68401 RepID=A0ACC1HPZ3_9FUNG|nr:hypothetical protein EV182_004799 [Spiromyces aspiralis]
MGVAQFILSYVQIVLGVIVWLDFCRGGYLGQCLAHFIMGSSFVAYAVYILLVLRLVGPWLRKFGRSPEFYDSCVIMLWGCFNTFTEHGFIEKANGARSDVRSMFPSLILAFTGIAMGAHEQSSEFSTRVHFLFGMSLVLTAITRCLELLLISTGTIKDTAGGTKNPFQYLPIFFLMLSGFLFMGANSQQLAMLDQMGVDVGTYGMGLASLTFLAFLYALFLMTLYRELDPFHDYDDDDDGGDDDADTQFGKYALGGGTQSRREGGRVYESVEALDSPNTHDRERLGLPLFAHANHHHNHHHAHEDSRGPSGGDYEDRSDEVEMTELSARFSKEVADMPLERAYR